MIERYFHRWEQQLADVSKHERLVHPFEWGDDWIDEPMDKPEGLSKVSAWVDRVMQDTDAFYTPEPARYTFTTALPSVQASGEAGLLTYASGFTTPHESNNTVQARYFPADPIVKPTAMSVCARSWQSSASRRCASACRITMPGCRRN